LKTVHIPASQIPAPGWQNYLRKWRLALSFGVRRHDFQGHRRNNDDDVAGGVVIITSAVVVVVVVQQ
jgi:hypothetical protein